MESSLELRQENIYKIKVLLLGDKKAGKSTLVHTFLHGSPPTQNIMTDGLNFYVKKCTHVPHQPSQQQRSVQYYCRIHLWDVSGTVCDKAHLEAFTKQKLFDQVAAYLLIFKDQRSFEQLTKQIYIKLPWRRLTSRESVYLIYNEGKQTSRELEATAEKFAKEQQMLYRKIQATNPREVNELFDAVKSSFFFKVADGIIEMEEAVLTDRQNRVMLRDFESKKNDYYEKRYNRCC